jgi:phytoene dehydrogenase-like protein
MPKKVNIIGGGIAGLTAGCYLQMNGYDSEIFELHSLPGGLCTSWQRGEYTVDGCLHWLVGSSPKDPIYKLWSEIVDMEAIEFYDYDDFFRVRDENGREIVGYSDVGRLEQELLEKAPGDKELIQDFIRGVKDMSKMKMRNNKAPELFTFIDKTAEIASFLPYLKTLARYSRMTIHDFAAKCTDPLLAKFFEYSFASEMPMLFIMITFGWLNDKNAGYPIGGSLRFSRLIEQKYLELGGKIHYNCRVEKILTEEFKVQGSKFKVKSGSYKVNSGAKGTGHRAKGIELENGEKYFSDITVSAADGYSTIFKMLEGKFVDDSIRRRFDTFPVFPSFLQISLGVNRTFDGYPSAVVTPLSQPFYVDPERTIDQLYYRIFNYDPTLAPPGKTLISCMIKTANYRYWQELRDNQPEQYKAEKNRILEFFTNELDRVLGDVRVNLEMTDVSTPATVARYTGNWQGSVEGWMVTRETGFDSMPKTLPGLENFYMCGQWVEPGGGVPSSFFSGRNLVQVICSKKRGCPEF